MRYEALATFAQFREERFERLLQQFELPAQYWQARREWRSPLALGYIARVKHEEDARTWLSREFRLHDPPCSPTYGCPRLSNGPG